MTIDAKIILDSIGPNGARLTTFELTYPRFVHAELMTHRMFSRNSASSRAIPTEKLLARISHDPAGPVWWGANQSGMQAREELAGDALFAARSEWLKSRDEMIQSARRLGGFGLHKQIANRIVEPWMFITVIVTATEWRNFFALRDHADAQPEIAACAAIAHRLYDDCAETQSLDHGQWHLPFVTRRDAAELRADGRSDSYLCLVSAGRCARVSYLTHDGQRDPDADVALCDKLLKSGHMSPLEHVAEAMTEGEWNKYAREMTENWMYDRIPMGNLWGWRQFRKTISREHDFGSIEEPPTVQRRLR